MDDQDNAADAGTYCFVDSNDNIIYSTEPQHLLTAIGVSDMIIVHTADATMICPKTEAQRVKDLVMKLKDKFGDRFQ